MLRSSNTQNGRPAMTPDLTGSVSRLARILQEAQADGELPRRWAARCLDATATFDGPDPAPAATRLLGLLAEHYLFVADKPHAALMFDALAESTDDVLALLRDACDSGWPPVHPHVTSAACDAVQAAMHARQLADA